jgi:hypothetical protein
MLTLMLISESDLLERIDLSMKLISFIDVISLRSAVIVAADAWLDINLESSARTI